MWRLSSHSKMLRNKPKLKYCGLTVVLSNPSRFDRVSLLSATGGHVFNDHCLRPDFNVMQCDIRVSDDKSPLLPDTKCVLLLGEGAMPTRNHTIQSSVMEQLNGVIMRSGYEQIRVKLKPLSTTVARFLPLSFRNPIIGYTRRPMRLSKSSFQQRIKYYISI